MNPPLKLDGVEATALFLLYHSQRVTVNLNGVVTDIAHDTDMRNRRVWEIYQNRVKLGHVTCLSEGGFMTSIRGFGTYTTPWFNQAIQDVASLGRPWKPIGRLHVSEFLRRK